MKRRLSRGLVIVLLAAIMLFFPLLAAPHRIDETHRKMVREGMTAAEVESIFGAPAGAYDWAAADELYAHRYALYRALIIQTQRQLQELEDRKLLAAPQAASPVRPNRMLMSESFQTWTSRHGSVTIGFNEAGRVSWISGWQKVRIEPPWKRWWDKIKGK